MKFVAVVFVCIFSLVTGACSLRSVAEEISKFPPTVYDGPGNIFFTVFGYGDEKIDANRQKIWFIGNMLTSVERVSDLAKFHAGMVGRQRGATHFSLTSYDIDIACSDNYVRATTIVTYGSEASLSGQVYDVEVLIQELEANARSSNVSYQARQKIFIAHKYSCSSQRLISPENVRTNVELRAAERAKANATASGSGQ